MNVNYFKKYLNKQNLFIFLVLLLVTAINYWRVPFLFWQQDEWLVYSLMVDQGIKIVMRGFGDSSTFHFIPITNLVSYLVFKIFGFNYSPFLIIGLLTHLVNALLLFKISQKIFKNYLYSVITAVVFIGSNSSYQLLMWPIISLNIVSLTFTLISALILLNFIENNKQSIKKSILTALFALLSIFSLEYAVGFLIFIPFVIILNFKKLNLRNAVLFLIPLFLVYILYFGLRTYRSNNQVSIVNNNFNYTINIGNILSYPFYYLGQIYVPEKYIIKAGKVFSSAVFDSQHEQGYYFKISFLLSLLILFLSIYLCFIKKPILKNKNKIVLTTLLFIGFSSIPFTLLTGKAGDFPLFPPRYMYFGSAAGAVLIVYLLKIAKIKKVYILFYPLIIITVILVGVSIFENWHKSEELYNLGNLRKSILTQIKYQYPSLPKKVVFYVESDSSYYGLPPEEKIPPFQSGLGQTLLMWYYPENKYPEEFYQNKYLWDITDEGYKEADGWGFGYFSNIDKLKKTIRESKIPINSVIGFSWVSKTNSLIDITGNIRKGLASGGN